MNAQELQGLGRGAHAMAPCPRWAHDDVDDGNDDGGNDNDAGDKCDDDDDKDDDDDDDGDDARWR